MSDRPAITEDQLGSWRLLEDFRSVLDKVAPAPCSRPPGGAKRLLTEEDYLCSVLFVMLNPVLDSMRGLCACSHLERVQQEVCARPVSLGSFSEAQHVFGSQRIEEVFRSLVAENGKHRGERFSRGGPPPEVAMIDSTLLRAVARMEWAQWREQNTKQRAVRLHLSFNLRDAAPSDALVTEGKHCERKAFEKLARPGEFYVGDRNYGRDYKMLKRLEDSGCRYLFRLCENANTAVVEHLALEDSDRAAGVVSDRIVQLGARECWQHGPVRVITIKREDMDEPVVLVTNCLDRASWSAELLAGLYRQRWSIELFFRWMKCILGRPHQWHWLAESAEGAAIQIYAALIAALLLARRLGRLPNKRTMEALRLHAMGWVESEELAILLAKAGAKQRT